MERMFWIDGSLESAPAIDSWLRTKPEALQQIARRWFERLRQCGDDVRETMHDGCPVACLDKYPYAYVNVFTSHDMRQRLPAATGDQVPRRLCCDSQ